MSALRLILGDQLSLEVSSLREADPAADLIVMAEVREEATYVRHHKKKIAFLFSAMRHFAAELEKRGFQVRYFRIEDDADGPHTLRAAVRRALDEGDFDEVIVTEAGEWRLAEEMRKWEADLRLPVRILEDDRFLCSHEEFAEWAEGHDGLLMENFYRMMRKKTGLLMEDGQPVGGRWNFDKENRKPAPDDFVAPKRISFRPDATTEAVLEVVENRYEAHFGSLERFEMAVTRDEALRALNRFMEEALPGFGDYQDAMVMEEAFLNHSLLSAYINAGLLKPLEVCERAEAAWREGNAPLNAVEGFIRQILGWREYIRGVYWTKMPDYAGTNHLQAGGKLPSFYWEPDETGMACMAEAVRHTRDWAYSHHIQRLMITGNFALLAGIDPAEVNEWYLAVYADAYEWVELPNTHGMALYADGGVVATKPYAASGNYINKMSDYCAHCVYNVKEKLGETACPFNYLYWDFLARNEDKLRGLRRLIMPYSMLDRFDDERRDAIAGNAARFLKQIGVRT